MAVVNTFINEKGGVGKTSCCFNVAWELSAEKKILLIDMDGQTANLTYLCGIKKEDDTITMYDVLKKNMDPRDAVVTLKQNLDLIPATVSVSDIQQNVKLSKMREVIKTLSANYDYIFIDVNPSPDWRHYLSLAASNYMTVIMLPDLASLEADNGILQTLSEVREVNPSLKVSGIVFNRHETRTNLGKEVRRVAVRFAHEMGTQIYEAKIRSATAIGELPSAHIGITEYDPKSKAAEDIRQLSKEIVASFT